MSTHRPLNVLCVANWPSDVGYAWWLMESFWAHIAEHYPTIIAFPTINTLPLIIERSSATCVEFDFRAHSLKQLRANVRFIKQHNIDVLYLTDYPLISWHYGIYRLAGIKRVVVHTHTVGTSAHTSGIKRVLKAWLVNSRLTGIDAGFAATDFVGQRLVASGCLSPSRCYVVPNGIMPPSAVQPHPLAETLAPFRAVIVTVGRASVAKGVRFAIDVMAYINEEYGITDIAYLFCGDGPDLEQFREYAAKRGVQEQCLLPGRVERLSDLLPLCHIGFHPSHSEVGYSLSTIESMYAGLPMVVPNNPAVCAATVDGEDGTVYVDGDVAAATAALLNYINDAQLRQRHGEAAKRSAQNNFSHQQTLRALGLAMERVTVSL